MEKAITTIHLTERSLRLFRVIFICLVSTFAGWFASTVAAMQTATETTKLAWYEQPVVIAGAVSASVAILMEIIKTWRENRKEKNSAETERAKQHSTSTDKKEELTYQERKDLLNEQKDLEKRKTAFYRDQFKLKEIEAFEARMRAHRFSNEVNRLHNHIYKCHHEIADKKGKIPEFQFKYHDELMKDIEMEVENFKKQLNEQIEKSIAPDKE